MLLPSAGMLFPAAGMSLPSDFGETRRDLRLFQSSERSSQSPKYCCHRASRRRIATSGCPNRVEGRRNRRNIVAIGLRGDALRPQDLPIGQKVLAIEVQGDASRPQAVPIGRKVVAIAEILLPSGFGETRCDPRISRSGERSSHLRFRKTRPGFLPALLTASVPQRKVEPPAITSVTTKGNRRRKPGSQSHGSSLPCDASFQRRQGS